MPENKEEAITYEYIRKVQREEQNETKLSKIPEDFYKKAKKYLSQKRKISRKKRDKSSGIEVDNIKNVLEDVFNRRETKILKQAVFATRTGIPPQNLTKLEEKFFNQLTDLLKYQREKTLNVLTKKTKEKTKLKKVKFTEDIPEFVGSDMKKYGPFKEGNEEEVPLENAKLMIDNGKAEKV